MLQKSENGFEYIEVKNSFAAAKIALQGAHLFHYQAAGKTPLFWVSQTSYYREGKAIRGGVPVCWPWFGPHKKDTSLPQHGFARTSKWEVAEKKELSDGSSVVVLKLDKPWEYAYALLLEIRVSEKLELSLTTTNLDTRPFGITEALHSYFRVGDISEVRLRGVAGCNYFDQIDSHKYTQEGDVVFNTEVDRIYYQPASILSVKDGSEEVKIGAEGSSSVVVWNPWIDKAASMVDVHDGGYREFVCVETANALDDERILEPSESHTLKMSVVY